MKFSTHINNKFGTNTYFLFCAKNSLLIIIDPGTDVLRILHAVRFFQPKNICVLLTHHHFDHMYSLPAIYDEFSIGSNLNVIGNDACKAGISSSKINLSEYSELAPVQYGNMFNIINSTETTFLSGLAVDVIQTPGHTASSVSYKIGNQLFVGDLMIKGHKTVTKLQSGDRNAAKRSILNLIEMNHGTQIDVFSGHGGCFPLSTVRVEDFIHG